MKSNAILLYKLYLPLLLPTPQKVAWAILLERRFFCYYEIKCTTAPSTHHDPCPRTSRVNIFMVYAPAPLPVHHTPPRSSRRTRTNDSRLSYHISHPAPGFKCIIVVFIHLVLTTPSPHQHTTPSFFPSATIIISIHPAH
jgi:hypothetical protein